jgi:hypothetical protein
LETIMPTDDQAQTTGPAELERPANSGISVRTSRRRVRLGPLVTHEGRQRARIRVARALAAGRITPFTGDVLLRAIQAADAADRRAAKAAVVAAKSTPQGPQRLVSLTLVQPKSPGSTGT